MRLPSGAPAVSPLSAYLACFAILISVSCGSVVARRAPNSTDEWESPFHGASRPGEKQADITRGEGDGEATKIFAQAFGQDQDFFQFYRSLQAYRKTLAPKDTSLVLSPDSEFLKYLDKATASQGR